MQKTDKRQLQGTTCGQRPHRNRTHQEARAQSGQNRCCTVAEASWQLLTDKEGSTLHAAQEEILHSLYSQIPNVLPDKTCRFIQGPG